MPTPALPSFSLRGRGLRRSFPGLRPAPWVWAAALSLSVAGVPDLPAQTIHRLTEPQAALADDFGAVQSVRELPDGRVLVADPLGGALYVVDLDAGTRVQVGREGAGPGEYRQPDAVWPFPGDSTLLVDLGNGRLSVLGPELDFGPTRPIAQGEFRPGTPPVVAIPRGVDAEGRLYFQSLPSPGAGGLPDSAQIVRMTWGGATEALARFKTPDREVSRSGGAGNQNVSIRPIPLSPEDAWGVAPDGALVVARAGSRQVEWVREDGTRTRGPALAHAPVRIGRAEREEWVAEQGRSGGGIGIGITVENGRPSMSFSRGGASGGVEEIDRYTWPDVKPPFYGGRIPVDPAGRAWVRRHVEAGEGTTYDVVDGAGRPVGRVVLPPGSRVAGFGEDAVYVVTTDEFDLNYLERHPLPAF